MKNTHTHKGITLIALIITIVVLLILAAVAISSITKDGIIDKAQEATSKYEIAQEKEKLQMEALELFLINSTGTVTLENHLAGIYGEENVQLNADNSVTVTVPSGNRYIVTEDGSVTLIDGSVQEPEAATISVSLDKTEITKEITHGESVTETITATLNNASGTLTWLSSDPDVAEIVTTEGNTRTIEIKKAGTATITVKYAENTSIGASCTITVTEKEIALTVTPTTISEQITRGTTVTKTLTATLTNASGTVTWKSSNTSVATVTGNDKTATVTLKGAGNATITASYDGTVSATCSVTVTEKEITLTVSPTTITEEIESGSTATKTLTATLTNASGTLNWQSSNTSVASVTGNGSTATVTLKGAGNATITVSYEEYSATCNVTVTEKESIATIPTTSSYVGYYANLDSDAEPEGIIYADLAHSVSGQWTDSDGTFSYTAITGTKDYYISQENYAGKFGTKDVITVAPNSTGSDRFYVMALEDINPGTYYCWYDAAYDSGISDYSTVTSTAFGKGKTNTSTMISKWNSSAYGAQNDNGTYSDMWGVIQDKVSDGWFVPSKEEWSAFGYNLGITSSNYSSKGLSPYCWSSSLGLTNRAWYASFLNGYMGNRNIYGNSCVRLSATF